MKEDGRQLMQGSLEPILGSRFTTNSTFSPSPSSQPMHGATHNGRGGYEHRSQGLFHAILSLCLFLHWWGPFAVL
jgi:hypothetical protein